MTKESDPDLLEMAARLQASGGGRGRRSPLFRWMFKRADAFNQMLHDTQPSWASVAEAAAELDLMDGAGKPPTAERVRLTWFAVRRAKGWVGKTPPSEAIPITSPAPIPQLPAGAQLDAFPELSPAPPAGNAHQAARDRMRARLRPITLPNKQEQTRDR